MINRLEALNEALTALDGADSAETRREVLINLIADIDLIVDFERATEPPAGHVDEEEGSAIARVASGMQWFLQRHYGGELLARGFHFTVGVFGELLSMAYAARLVHVGEDVPHVLPQDVKVWVAEKLLPRIEFYRRNADANQSRVRNAVATASRTPHRVM